MDMENLIFCPVENADMPLIAEWLGKSHISKWYGDPQEWLKEIEGRNGDYSWIRHFVVMAGKEKIGFCQYYDCYHARELESWYRVDTKGEVFSIDYFIGEEAYLGKGYGKKIVKQLTELIESIENAARIIVQPEADNAASLGVLLSNGYIFDEKNKYFEKSLM